MAKSSKTAKPANSKAAAKEPAKQAAPTLSAPPPAEGQPPSIRVLAQYLKDLSFENPQAPQSLGAQLGQPDIKVSVNVNARNISPTDFEVELHLDAKAENDGKVIFESEILYAGVFRLENYPQNILHAAVLIQCPSLLFPFARQIMAEATRNGGFPPLMLDPVDFAGMYQNRMRQAQNAASA